MFNATPDAVTKRDFLMFFYKYRARLVWAFFIPFLICVAVSFVPTARYKATSFLIVRLGSEYVYQPETNHLGTGPTLAIPFAQDQIFKSEVAILSSDDLHEQVINTVGLDKLYPKLTMPKAVEKFGKRLDILLQKDSAVIDLSFEHENPAMAVAVLDSLLKHYFDKRKLLYRDPRSDRAKEDMENKREQALATSRAVEEYKRSHNMHSLEEQRADLLKRRSETQRQSMFIANPGLKYQLGVYNSELNKLDTQEHEYGTLQQDANIAQEAYRLASHKFDEASAYEQQQRDRDDSVRIIQQPKAAAEPKQLQPLIIMAGFFLSLLSVLIIAAMSEFSRSGFNTPEQIEHELGVPVLAVISMRK